MSAGRRGVALTLLVPGLAGPEAAGGGSADEAAALLLHARDAPGFARLHARGEMRRVPGTAHTLAGMLFEAFGIARADGGDWPAGAVSRHGIEGDAGREIWMRADPVNLRADLARLRVLAPETLDLTLDEATRIAGWLNTHEHGPGLRLEPATARCWLVRLDAAPRIACTAPCEAHGRDADASLPRGPEAAAWHARLNELQMLLHACPVNEERAMRGLPAVNSVWFWGAGVLPPETPVRFDAVFGDHDLVPGLAAIGARRARSLPVDAGALLDACGPGEHLAALDLLELPARSGDVAAWCEGFAALEAHWLAPLAAALGRGAITRIDVHAGGGAAFRITARAARRWWRRVAPAPVALCALRRVARW